jgi:uncharacterized protein YggU (UPF0235/DUF167 family)
MNCLTPHPEGVMLLVKAQPGMLKVAVTQIAEKGKANQALVEALAEGLGLKRSQIELVSGESQREKRFLVRGANQEQLSALIAKLLAKQ